MSTLEKHRARPGQERRQIGARARAEARLQRAFEQEDISLDALEERLLAVQRATSLAQIDEITADLPDEAIDEAVDAGEAEATRSTALARAGEVPAGGWAIAVLGGATRKGRMTVPTRLRAVAALGGVELDLRDAVFGPVTTITAVSVMGGVEIKLPETVRIEASGVGVLGGFENNSHDGPAGAPLVRIRGAAVMGGVEVRVGVGQRDRDR